MSEQGSFEFEVPIIPGADSAAEFDGETYESDLDYGRLAAQLHRVYECMKDQKWRTLEEIARLTRDREASISARLRDFRKEKYGSHTVNRQRRGEGRKGLFEYQLIPHIKTDG